ncbi:neprilysin-1-like [Dermacentor andersoni]|uniref:neprilysin-1-like n=1 Tax=Dermacentor andersoni TaxID=34620 RepID=UPI003B3AD91B
MSSARGSVAAAARSQGDVAVKSVSKKTDTTTTSVGRKDESSSSSPEATAAAAEPPSWLQSSMFRYKPRWRRYARCVLPVTSTALLVCLAIPAGIRYFVGCQSPTCERWIEEMSDSIDDTKKPCDNFYDFVCGQYDAASHSFFPNAFASLQIRIVLSFYKRIMIQDLDAMREDEGEDSPRFKAVYMTQRCIYEAWNGVDNIDMLKEFLASYNLSWPPDKQRLPASLLDTLVELSLKRDVHVFFQLQPDKDLSRPGFYLLHWDINIQSIVAWLLLREVLIEMELLEKAFVESAVVLTGGCVEATVPHPQLIARVIELDSRFLTISVMPLLALRNNATLEYVKFSEAHSFTGQAGSSVRLLHAVNRLLPADRQLSADDQMIVKNKFILAFVGDLLLGEYSGSETVSGYVAFLVALQLAPAMSGSYLEALLPGIGGWPATFVRLMTCLVFPNQELSYAMADLFVEWYVEDGKLAAIRAMSAALWNATEAIIANLSWIDESTRERGLGHIQRLGRVVGHPFDLSASKEQLRAHYAFVPRLPASHAAMFTAVHDAQATRRLARLKAPDPEFRSEDPEQPMILVNAFYLPVYHWVFIMDGIMFAPFYALAMPESVNYGALGHVVGHEVTHGFDPVLGVFNASGLKDDWWSPESRKLFDQRIQCLRDLYNAAPWTHGIKYGDTALSENFADCGGMAKVLRALQELGPQADVMLGGHRFTALQAFFVSSCFKWCTKSLPKRKAKDDDDEDKNAEWVRLYSPLNMRCNVPLMNTPVFADAFSCAPGTVMNSKVRCDLF